MYCIQGKQIIIDSDCSIVYELHPLTQDVHICMDRSDICFVMYSLGIRKNHLRKNIYRVKWGKKTETQNKRRIKVNKNIISK